MRRPNGSPAPERPIEGCRAFRGRLACNLSGLWGDRVLRTWNADDKNHKFKLTEYTARRGRDSPAANRSVKASAARPLRIVRVCGPTIIARTHLRGDRGGHGEGARRIHSEVSRSAEIRGKGAEGDLSVDEDGNLPFHARCPNGHLTVAAAPRRGVEGGIGERSTDVPVPTCEARWAPSLNDKATILSQLGR